MAPVDNTIPSGFGGGLTRFKEEYDSKFKFSPNAVVVMVVLVILFVLGLKIFFPLTSA
jgi:preprotein translocase subunit Sec61beta